jgi:hypothetical protein
MARRRGNSSSTFYVSTNPLDNVPIGLPGQGVAIGRLGVLIFSESEQIVGFNLVTESAGDALITESAGDNIVTEGA